MLKFVSYPLKTKKMCKHVAAKIAFVIRHVPYQYKTK